MSRFAQRLAHHLITHPWLVITAFCLLAFISLAQIIDLRSFSPRLLLDPSIDSILPVHDEDRAFFEDVKKQFDSGETILVAVQDENIFTIENLEKIYRMSDHIEHLDQVNRVSSLSTALNIRSEDDLLIIEEFYNLPVHISDLPAAQQRSLTDPIHSGNLISHNGHVSVLLVHLLDLPEQEILRSGVDGAIADIVHEEWQHGEVWITGNAHVKAELSYMMLRDVTTVIPIAILVMCLIAAISFRTVRGVLIPLLTVCVSVLTTLAFMSLLYDTLNQVTIAVPSLLVVVGFAYTIHVISNYYDVVRQQNYDEGSKDKSNSPAWLALTQVASPVIYTGITTGIGFLSLATSPLGAIQQFGIGAGVGALITTFVSLTFAIALLQVLPVPVHMRQTANNTWMDRGFRRLAKYDIQQRKKILLIGALAAFASAISLPSIHINTDLVNSFRADSQVRHDFAAVNKNLEGANSFYIMLATEQFEGFTEPDNLRVIEQLQLWLAQQPEVGGSTSISDYIKVIHKGMFEDQLTLILPAEKLMVDQLLAIGDNEELTEFVTYDYQQARIIVRTRAMASNNIMTLSQRIENYLNEQIPSHLQARLTGNTWLVAKTMDDVVIGQVTSIAMAFAFIYFILVYLFRSFRLGVLALLPNVIPVLLYFGILSASSIDLNVTTGLIACIVFGIAVDDTIHLMVRYKQARMREANTLESVTYSLTTVGRPVTYTTSILCCGFLCLIFSEMLTQMEFGVLSAITLLGAWIVDVTFTPALMSLIKTRR